jgi:hypothetical protein
MYFIRLSDKGCLVLTQKKSPLGINPEEKILLSISSADNGKATIDIFKTLREGARLYPCTTAGCKRCGI